MQLHSSESSNLPLDIKKKKKNDSQIFLEQTQAHVCVISIKRGAGTTLFAIAISLIAAGRKSLGIFVKLLTHETKD